MARLAASIASGESTCSMAIAAAPRTPACHPACGGTIAQVLGRQRQRALVDDLADAGEQVLAGRGELAADDDDRRVDEVDHRGDDVADVAAGLADHGDGVARRRPAPGRRRPGRARPSTPRARSAAASAGPAATASRQPTLPQRHRTSSARATRTCPRSPAVPWAPRWSRPPETMPAPMPVATLISTRSSTSARWVLPLAEGHDVDVVVDQHRHVVVALDVAGHVVPVPAGHDRRVDRTAGGVLDGAGQADADRGQLGDVASVRCAAATRPCPSPSRGRPSGPRRCRGLRAHLAEQRRRTGPRAPPGRAWRRCRRRRRPGPRG